MRQPQKSKGEMQVVLSAAAAWGLAIIFATSALEKIISPNLRERFLEAVADFVPATLAPAAKPLAAAFVLLEAAALPLLFFAAAQGIVLLATLTAVVGLYAAIRWLQGNRLGECPCGGIWAASGRNLLLRNLVLAALALYVWFAAPRPLPLAAWPYTIGAFAVLLLIGGFAEAVRVKMRMR